ncbi:MFS transporter [Chryseomicrobium aureum]|uniref:MFS transporter n=1 Tax=Chryseomicrobium aureum TaxID=1441723 RepID=UPI001EF9216A|nr:MFS transporter [Chryseomicrobium aureum]MBM7706361.1 MFS family permease [Chryseomicrobium aureum]
MKNWKNRSLLLVGIGTSTLGGWVYLIALNLMVLERTESVIAVSVLYILGPLATLFTNFWAGSFIDRTNSKHLMIVLDILRAALIGFLPIMPSIFYVYILVFFINVASTMFEPTSMVYMTKLIREEDRQRFNALRGLILSCGTLFGPAVAGLLFFIGSAENAIYINSLALLVSAGILLLLPTVDLQSSETDSRILSWAMVKKDISLIYSFSYSNTFVIKIYLLFIAMLVMMTSLDSIEAAFIKQSLELSDTNYGLLLSLFGAGILLGSAINTLFTKYLAVNTLIGYGSLGTTIGYILLYSSQDFMSAVIGTVLIGFAFTFANTGYLTFYQNHVPASMMGRFSSLFGIVQAFMIIVLTGGIGLAATGASVQLVGFIGSLVFLTVGLLAWRMTFRRSSTALELG